MFTLKAYIYICIQNWIHPAERLKKIWKGIKPAENSMAESRCTSQIWDWLKSYQAFICIYVQHGPRMRASTPFSHIFSSQAAKLRICTYAFLRVILNKNYGLCEEKKLQNATGPPAIVYVQVTRSTAVTIASKFTRKTFWFAAKFFCTY